MVIIKGRSLSDGRFHSEGKIYLSARQPEVWDHEQF